MVSKVLGTAGDDVLSTTAADDRIWGGAGGTDTAVFSGNADDYAINANGDGSFTIKDLRAGAPDGTDVVRAIDVLRFADGDIDFQAYFDARRDDQYGSDGNDVLLGGAGDDTFFLSAGQDRIWGGNDGFDTLKLSGHLQDYSVVDNGNGSYTLSGSGSETVVRGIDQFVFADATLDLSDLLADRPNEQAGTLEADTLRGTAGDDILTGGGGDDRIWGGSDGYDLAAYSGAMADYGIWARGDGSYGVRDLRAEGADGHDIVRDIEAFRFSDRTATLEEFVAAYVPPTVQTVTGTDGNDVVFGTDLDDTFVASAGNDRIWGGQDGTDTLQLSGALSDYVITDNETGGAYTFVDTRAGSPDGTNVVRDVEFVQFADVRLAWGEVLSAASSETTTESYSGTAADDQVSGAHTDGLSDAHSNDVLVGNAGTDRLRGGPGDDVIVGDESAQTVAAPAVTSFPTTNLAPFDFEAGLYQIINGQLNKLDPETGSYIAIGEDQNNYNAVGLNEADGFAYGIGSRNTEFAGYLLRIGAEGDVEPLIGGFPSVAAGGFADDGRLYIRTGARDLKAIDVETLETENLSFSGVQPGAVHDIVFVPDDGAGRFYGLSKYGQLVSYDLDDRTVTSVTSVTVDNLDEVGPFGAGWTAADGGLYFSDNSTGNIYGISGVENGQPRAALLAVGGTSNINDGFSFGSAPLPEFLRNNGVDYLLGGSGSDQLIGGSGDDFLDGGVGADVLTGGEGLDTADYTRASAAVVVDLSTGGLGGEAAGDSFESIERLEGSAFADVLTGDAMANVLRGRGGDDVLSGAGGDDVLRGDGGEDRLDGGDGFDTATYFSAQVGVTIDLALGQGLSGDAAGDVLVSIEAVQGADAGGDTMTGSAGVDHLYGFGGNDVLSGGGDSDVIHGGDDNDVIDGGAGSDFLLGQSGNDTISAGDGADNVQGGDGDDHLRGDDGDDRLFGGAGNDRIAGGRGDDHLRGGEGFDVLTGEAGADTFHFSTVSGADTITDFEIGIDALDFSDIAAVSTRDDLLANVVGEDLVITLANGADDVAVTLAGSAGVSFADIDLVI